MTSLHDADGLGVGHSHLLIVVRERLSTVEGKLWLISSLSLAFLVLVERPKVVCIEVEVSGLAILGGNSITGSPPSVDIYEYEMKLYNCVQS